ncbi:hypothetical protein GGS26DRAFT_592135 [Hypomontagnella submonticulosa]|nr:hypothetical protein GGS26DRAFT_592135 [Hypomontagnella submonticulosa]
MSSIGPQLPPQTTKRKRTADDESIGPPAAKLRVTDNTNRDEIDLSSDDDDDSYGPSAPKPKATTSIGPTLPPANADEINLDVSDNDGIGPSAPPPPAAMRPSIGPTLPTTNQDEIPLEDDGGSSDGDVGPAPPSASGPALPLAPPPTVAKRVHGPAPPPAPLSERPPTSPNANSNSEDSDDDDDYGPALPTSSSHISRATQARAAEAATRAAALAAGPQRDDWMLAPPSANSAYRAPDPTKLKNRRFASGPRSGATANKTGGGDEISSIWTETPEQKRRRLENAVLGREGDAAQKTTSNSNNAGPSTGAAGQTAEAAAQQARIRSFTEATRGKSLYEEHQSSRKGRTLREDEEEDDPSKRAFDREKDMKLGGRIGTAQRRELLNRAADFGGRFEKGKFL